MSNQNHINEIIEKFYICANLPIRAFHSNGQIICSAGYDDKMNRLFVEYNIYEMAKRKIIKDNVKSIVTIPCLNDIYFTAYNVYSEGSYSGLFILGPHSCDKNNKLGIPFKPIYLMHHIISLLESILKDKPNCCLKYSPNGKVYSLHVKKAIDYINSRYNEDITLIDITNYLNINKCYFCSIFKKETGKTFTEFLNEVRIKKSKKLLAEGNSSILDIALQVGFNNQNYYNILFKKLTNKTPSEFRNSATG